MTGETFSNQLVLALSWLLTCRDSAISMFHMVIIECAISVSGPSHSKTSVPTPAHRVILHFDLDCFYAQVEMLRNPALREVPLGQLF